LNSIAFQEYANQFDFLIAYSKSSYWYGNKIDLNIIGILADECTLIRYTKNEKGILPFIESVQINTSSFNSLLNQLTKSGFWNLSLDSLNQTCINDDCFVITDGVGYRFEIITKDAFRVVSSYMPEAYLKQFPSMTQRKTFIDCRNIFNKFLKNNL